MNLPSVYEPKEYEENIYALWERNGVFEPKARGNNQTFSLVIPPPNANANMHIGTGFTIAIEDVMARFHRMQGKATLFVPGADHAGFETWVVYEKKLSQEGKSRFDFTRDELYKQVWDFVASNRKNFETMFRQLGASVDWSRFSFTLDNKIVMLAYETFKKMWDEGLIYRGKRIVNFCTFHGTSFADIEVEHQDEATKLWHIAYPLADGKGELVIATTRPETKLGQSALMVNPKDPRYKAFVGQQVLQPLVPDSPIPVIADEHVDPDFGTGVVTVTPGHDPNDFEVAERHKLPVIELITTEGKMSDAVPAAFRGLSVKEARDAVVKALEEKGLLRKTEDYSHTIGVCYKCGTPIEPLALEQWFVSMQPLAKQAIEVLEKKKIAFYPDSKREQLIGYLKNLRDWNISRQIAWGIPIPAFQNVDDPEDWIFSTDVSKTEIEVKGKLYRRDPDVFDTWFSSGSWPYATLDYPDGDEFKHFYPLSVMETGGEILYPWVSRMIMMGLYVTGKIPFEAVYIHGYVMAEDGSKMSKSRGNTIDLGEVLNTYGSDALRMGIIAGRTPAVNRGYDSRRVEEARNFSNKLWNIARFTEAKLGDNHGLRADPKPTSFADHWIMLQLKSCAEVVTQQLQQYRFSEAYEKLYHFVWDDLADWYVEASKVQLNEGVLAYVLEATLKMVHPFAPFVTESIWQTLAWEQDSILAVQPWPKPVSADAKIAEQFSEIKAIVSESRLMISQLQVVKPTLYYTDVPFLADNADLLIQLAGLGGVSEVRSGRGLHLTKTTYTCWLDIDKETAQHYLAKLHLQQAGQQKTAALLESRLSNKTYVSKAPKELVNQTRDQLAEVKKLLDNISNQISTFTEATADLEDQNSKTDRTRSAPSAGE